MIPRALLLVPVVPVVPVMLLAGCLPDSFSRPDKVERVPTNPFSGGGPAAPESMKQVNYAPAPPELSQRVDYIGRKLIAANPQIAMRPYFATAGSPSPEMFHQGTNTLWITAGLVQQCKAEAQLAAVMSYELGRMVSEREAKASPTSRNPEGLPPPEVPIGQAGNTTSPDLTHLAELGLYERAQPRVRRGWPAPDPNVLARIYLEKAGYAKTDLDGVQPLLQAAERNYILEKQLKAPQTQPNWGQ